MLRVCESVPPPLAGTRGAGKECSEPFQDMSETAGHFNFLQHTYSPALIMLSLALSRLSGRSELCGRTFLSPEINKPLLTEIFYFFVQKAIVASFGILSSRRMIKLLSLLSSLCLSYNSMKESDLTNDAPMDRTQRPCGSRSWTKPWRRSFQTFGLSWMARVSQAGLHINIYINIYIYMHTLGLLVGNICLHWFVCW